ncbi:uncharacterized protein C8A04DRAFT_28605 [Dichotomopilus funicola]|uniref:peptidylprolyl isomerase n=1 Tax=Dichotomopilus funicola TaxID=1934379 RepID=A0AAN6V356_9PEZI|nr:hypothetical protein C8A04DRAFT_28605 [Dichotomopilus funicola]
MPKQHPLPNPAATIRKQHFLHTFRASLCRTFHDHGPDHKPSASWPSFVLPNDPGRGMYLGEGNNTHAAAAAAVVVPVKTSNSQGQIPVTPWVVGEGGTAAAAAAAVPAGASLGRVTSGPGPQRALTVRTQGSHHTSPIFRHHHRSTPPTASSPGPAALLALSDSVRASLAKHANFGPQANALSFFLQLALLEETTTTSPLGTSTPLGTRTPLGTAGVAPSLDFETIKYARLDKLVAELTVCGEMPFTLAPRFVHDVVTAARLEQLWRGRFGVEYALLDEVRVSYLASRWMVGAGSGSGSNSGLRSGGEGGGGGKGGIGAVPRRVRVPKLLVAMRLWPGVRREQGRVFSPGEYYLNLPCAHLDGVVSTAHETTISTATDDIPTLPLLTGREIHAGHLHHRVRYLREATSTTLSQLHPALIPHPGRHVRVLRGYQLRSPFAPAVGIRNDGLWKVLRYGERLIHRASGRYRLEIDLEQVPGQPPMAELMAVPRPSHLDDWDLYRRLEPAPPLRIPRQSEREGEVLAQGQTRKGAPREQEKTNDNGTAVPVPGPLEDGGPGNSVKKKEYGMGKKDTKSSGGGGKADKGDSKSKKGNGGTKGKGDGDAGDAKGGGKLKGMTINVRHILCEKFAKSEQVIERLNNGEKFDAVAKEMSEDKAKAGGSLGWKTKGSLDPQFEEVAFKLPPSPVDSPTFERVKTGFGYHIIMVEGRK